MFNDYKPKDNMDRFAVYILKSFSWWLNYSKQT